MRQRVYTEVCATLSPLPVYREMVERFGDRTVAYFVWEATDELVAALGGRIPDPDDLTLYITRYIDNILMLFGVTKRLPTLAKLDQLAHASLVEGCFPSR